MVLALNEGWTMYLLTRRWMEPVEPLNVKVFAFTVNVLLALKLMIIQNESPNEFILLNGYNNERI